MKGFTLIETLIAVCILTLSIVGPLVAANRAIVSAQISRDQLTASYLAQEGIEYVRAIRDNVFLTEYMTGGANVSANAWNSFITGIIDQCRSAECSIDLTLPMGYGPSSSLYQCSGNECKLYLLSNGVYSTIRNVQGGTITSFSRTIKSTGTPNDEQIASKVSWSFHGTTYSTTVYDHLTPWQ